MEQIPFATSAPHTLGIELELQLIDAGSFDLTAASDELLAQVAGHRMADRVKPEITRSMIELNSSVHEHPAGLLAEMREMRDVIGEAADALGIVVSGGGAHPFMRWQERCIHDSPRFRDVAETYGYLARQFTVFGQHIHVGTTSGDAAIHLARGLSPYVPHFIALSAASPYFEGVDTLYSCCRLNAVSSFPLAGHIPADMTDWRGFEAHMARLRGARLAESIKDLYWDIRPKPEFGTVEIRVCDTPLTVDRACQLAAFAQALAVRITCEGAPDGDAVWLAYRSNHFQACRFGLHGAYVTPEGRRVRLGDHLRTLLERLEPIADELGTADMLRALRDGARRDGNDAHWMRAEFQRLGDLPAVVESMARAWRGERAPGTADFEVVSSISSKSERRRAGVRPGSRYAMEPVDQLH
jgi:carboxylate-amine ligase